MRPPRGHRASRRGSFHWRRGLRRARCSARPAGHRAPSAAPPRRPAPRTASSRRSAVSVAGPMLRSTAMSAQSRPWRLRALRLRCRKAMATPGPMLTPVSNSSAATRGAMGGNRLEARAGPVAAAVDGKREIARQVAHGTRPARSTSNRFGYSEIGRATPVIRVIDIATLLAQQVVKQGSRCWRSSGHPLKGRQYTILFGSFCQERTRKRHTASRPCRMSASN